MTDQAADRLLRLDSGDAALLYLHFLRHGDLSHLTWSQQRLDTALDQLKKLGMAPEQPPVSAPPVPETPPPEYSLEDITAALKENTSTFPALCDEVERRLGKKLSANDLRSLYTLYDHLGSACRGCFDAGGLVYRGDGTKIRAGTAALPVPDQKGGLCLGPARASIRWSGPRPISSALTHLRGREAQVLRLLDIPPHPLVSQERTYIAAWDDMGFDDEALRMAYEKTVLKKQSMDWGYMNGILRRWHQKGLHTAAAIQAGDRDPRPCGLAAASGGSGRTRRSGHGKTWSGCAVCWTR